MRRHVSWCLACAFVYMLMMTVAATAQGQTPSRTIQIAVAIEDENIGGVISSIVRAEIRSLGDVQVVDSRVWPTAYVLRGLVACMESDCKQATAYAVSLRLYSPIRPGDIEVALMFATVPLPADSLRTLFRVHDRLNDLERTHQSWSAFWGREVYERAAREFVRRLDSQCFEQTRVLRRLLDLPRADYSSAYKEQISDRKWIC